MALATNNYFYFRLFLAAAPVKKFIYHRKNNITLLKEKSLAIVWKNIP